MGVIVGLLGVGLTSLPARASVSSKPKLSASTPTMRRGGKLSPRLSVLGGKQSLAAARAAAPAVFSLPASGPGSLVRRADGRLLVEIRTANTTAATVARLRARGAAVVNVSARNKTVTAAVVPSVLAAIASDAAVKYVNEVLAPITSGTGRRAGTFKSSAAGCSPTISEGDTLMNVAAARAAKSVDGSGQTIGVLSDSYNKATAAPTHAAADIASGDLPGPGNPCGYATQVKVQSEYSGSPTLATDEGRAMLELAHGLAPGANLAFATAANGQNSFAAEITKLRTANHASVIVDDSQYLDEPFFQDGPVSQAVNAASAAGVAMFSAAGNSNVIVGGKNVSSYETPAFRPQPCPVWVSSAEGAGVTCHDFIAGLGVDTGDDITVAPGGGFDIDLQWAQPWGSLAGHDYDAFILDGLTGAVLSASAFDQDHGFPEPFEAVGYTNTTASPKAVQVVIVRYSGTSTDRLKFAVVDSAGISSVQYDTSNSGDIIGPTIFGHNGAATVGSTAAIPYNDSTTSEDYSSRGPVTLYYQPTPSTAALASPQVLNKPDFAATDNVQNVFFAEPSGGGYRFPGTSAAAPQAAAIGALLRQYDPAIFPAEIMSTLRNTAQPIATNGTSTDVGGGYLDAQAALLSVIPHPGPPQTVSATSGNGQVALQWSTPAFNPGFPITGYVVTPTNNGVPEAARTFNSTATSQVVTGLANGHTYTFTVTGFDAGGSGAGSGPSAPIVVGQPGAPSGVTTQPANGAAVVSWKIPAVTYGIPITGYDVSMYRDGVFQKHQVFNSPATHQKYSPLVNAASYQFSVKAINIYAIGPESGLSAPQQIGVPNAPRHLSVTAGNGTARIRWFTPNGNGNGVVRYRIYTSLNGGAASGPVLDDRLSHVFTHLKQGGHYTFLVAAENPRGVGAFATAGPIIVGAPAQVTGVTATAAHKAAKLHWKVPKANGKPITGYTVTAYISGVAKVTKAFVGTATTRTITGLATGKTYTFAVAAKNVRGTGAKSAPSKPVKVK